ncbi:hypothetical protein F2P81_018789 [Scophthalmus maximus]|uniref:Uncharacterized protein n=1 Tax=Scophthalmus maximus TaxID=52904 RepID=A0A6A4SFK4_SCOMX|nr:hypothetical protein F2P81_018789 [Scophthalmus maximus]
MLKATCTMSYCDDKSFRKLCVYMGTHACHFTLHIEMDDFEQEGINEELIEFAIRESLHDAHKLPCSSQTNRESDSRARLPLHAAAVQPQQEILHVVLQVVVTSTELTLEEQTDDGDTALTLAAEAGLVENVGCAAITMLLLRNGAKVTSRDGHGVTPLGVAAEYGNAEALDILVQHENYGDLRKTPLYFAVSNGDVTCAEMLLAAGARSDLDPLRCILVAVRAERCIVHLGACCFSITRKQACVAGTFGFVLFRYELVRLLLSYGAEVNCYFGVITDTVFPTALQYCLRDHAMLRLLLNSGYHAHKCFQCCHGDGDETDSSWTDLHNQAYQIYSQPDVISFCEFVSVLCLAHVVGSVARLLLDYVGHVRICPDLRRILEKKPEWDEISDILSKTSFRDVKVGLNLP